MLYIPHSCYISHVLVIYRAFLLYVERSCYISRIFVISPVFLLYARHSCYISRSVLRAVPLPALVRAFELIKTAHGVNPSGTTSGTKTGRPSHNEAKNGPKNETKYIRLNETLLTIRHPKRHHPANEENQEYENANTRIAPSSSQSPPGYHQSAKS